MLSVIIVKFSSTKVGIVHKYHNHGLRCLSPSIKSPTRGRHYSTTADRKSPVIFVPGQEQPADQQTIPFVETHQITWGVGIIYTRRKLLSMPESTII